MPPLPVITNGYLVTQHYVAAGELHDYVNVVMVVNATTGATHAQIAGKVAQSIASTFMTVIPSFITLGVTDVLPLDGTSAKETFATPAFGTAGSVGVTTPFPISVGQLVTLQTGLRGRSHRGRMYLPGLSNDYVTADTQRQLTNAAHAALQTEGTAFLTILAGTPTPSLILGVLSRRLNAYTPVVVVRASSVACSQRRRYERVAHH